MFASRNAVHRADSHTKGVHRSNVDIINGSFQSTLMGLTVGMTYHVRAVATNAYGASYSADYTFQTEAGITLAIRLGANNSVVLSWTDPANGYVLQQTANMNAPNGGWMDVNQSLSVPGPNKQLTLPITGQVCFFRLRRL